VGKLKMMSKGLLSGSPFFYVNQQVRYGKGIFQGESGIAKNYSQINLAKRGRGPGAHTCRR